jgi:3-hydroxyacyl-CoA dehydrogenase
VRKIAIIGAGSIGVSWAIVFARAGHGVAMQDPDPGRLKAAATEIEHRLATLAQAGLIDEPAAIVAARVSMHGELGAAVTQAVHIQECAPERLDLKAQLLEEIDALAPAQAVIASSSSAISIGESARHLAGRARCLVVHPANPPHLLPVVELVPAPFTDPDATERTAKLLRDAGMSPVHVRREVEGFVYNRLQGAVLREAYCLVRDGVISVEELDQVMREGLGRRWAVIGPFETVDLNTRGGIAAHAAKMGPAYARMGAERGQDDPWDDDLVSTVAAQRRALLPLSEWEERVEWRDAELIRQEQGRRAGTLAQAPENTGVPHSARPGQ